MHPEFERLLKIALSDGIITDKKRAILLRKAESLGMDIDEAEMILESGIPIMTEEENASQAIGRVDNYDITDEELLVRCNKWISHCNEVKYIGKVEKFPKASEKLGHEKYLKMGSDIANKGIGYISEGISGYNVTEIASDITSFASGLFGNNKKELKHKQILELAEAYMIILETRATHKAVLKDKYEEMRKKLERNLDEYNNRSRWKKLWG